jgi:hypothetical protein
MNALKSLWNVGIDLVVGDDPKIAVAVLATLAVAAGLVLSGLAASVVLIGGALLMGAAFGLSVLVDVRRSPGDRAG